MKKKIFVFMFFALFIMGCSSHNKKTTPEQVINDIMGHDYHNSEELYHKIEKDYYATLLESETEVSLIILKKDDNNEYKFFGSTKYAKDRDHYGRYVYGDNDTLIIIFSKNTEGYSDIVLTFNNLEKQNETAIINSKIDEKNFVIDFFILPSNYNLIRTELK